MTNVEVIVEEIMEVYYYEGGRGEGAKGSHTERGNREKGFFVVRKRCAKSLVSQFGARN